ncbi:MAG: elongation factor P maturation arginine rhamnosyltransferase EarP [Paucibacter sp.]|nr:elongation factor P maturation arginine rhamnosyltransferase EarP [Roseateles sp.]
MQETWELFCRVIDNYGDIGVSWRLARDLATRGRRVRLWVDDAAALGWMAPQGWPQGIEVLPWEAAASADHVGDVVVETFGCELPERFVAAMAGRATPPRWINLEYLSAEDYVERSHALASPQFSGPGQGLVKHFFYPGFTPRTGGLLREPGLIEAQPGFDRRAWLAARGIAHEGERIVSLFAYANADVRRLLGLLADAPTLVLACAGALPPGELAPTTRWHALPLLSQPEYDHLLWSADLNFVRGEDSFVRAQWAGKPFVWHIYEQDDGVHAAKLDAFLARYAPGDPMAQLWRAWNGLAGWPAELPSLDTAAPLAWRAKLLAQPDLVTQLLDFTRSC